MKTAVIDSLEEISAEKSSFRRAFRLGARLMLEALGTPEALETGGGV